MRTAQEIRINYFTKAAYEMASSLPCPQSVNDVFNLGISLQYCIRAKYLEIAELINDKAYLVNEGAQQLIIKSKIEKLAAYKLNIQMNKFYEQGGPIMEDPVTNEMVKQIQPFFNRIVSHFLQSLDRTASRFLTKEISVDKMISEIKQQIAETYTNLGKMYQVNEIVCTFDELVELVKF